MKKVHIIGIHIAVWLIFLAYTYTLWLGGKPDSVTTWLFVSINIARIITFYYCYDIIFRRYLTFNKKKQLILGVISAYFVFAFTRYGLEEVLYPQVLGFRNYHEDTSMGYYLVDNIFEGLPIIVLSAAVFAISKSFQNERINQQLKSEVQKAELAFLRSQINPHFLYNSLNYLYSLALPLSDKMATAIIHLSDMMRYTLSESKDGKVLLSQEIKYIEAYLSLFRMRFEPDFYADLKVQGTLHDQRISPLLLIPFVENALKHGIVDQQNKPVRIAVSITEQYLLFEVENYISTHEKDQSGGIGLVNTRKRLALLYPDQHELNITATAQVFNVFLQIKM